MAEFAELIRIRTKSVEINGEEFPWYVSDDGIVAETARGKRITVTLTIPCDRVEIEEPGKVTLSD